MSEICRICRKPLATDEDHTVFQLIDWEDPANGDPDDYRLDLCWSEYAGGEHLTPEGALIEDELEHVIGQRDKAEAEVVRLTRERVDLREKFWRELYGLPNPTEIMRRFDRATLAGEDHHG